MHGDPQEPYDGWEEDLNGLAGVPISVELFGGPMDGAMHQIERGFDPPDFMGLIDGNRRVWYAKQPDGLYLYLRTEQVS